MTQRMFNKVNNLLGWLCALIATVVYALTSEGTTSWWDCGEFIAAAYKLQVVHQPGAPLFLMVQNLFSNFAFGDKGLIAFCMNIGSVISSGLTVMFLFWTITALVRKISFQWNSTEHIDQLTIIKTLGAGFLGAMAFAFTDTFWYSAVESEVYAMSSLCTAVVFWLILKWEVRAEREGAERWIILTAYVMGLSIGVHLLNLLVIPVIALVIYYRKCGKPTLKGMLKAALIGVSVLAFILWGIIQYLVKGAAYADLFFVNTLGLDFGWGIIVYSVLIIASLIGGIKYSIRKCKPILNTTLLCISFIIFGYCSFAMVLIRADANPSLNNNAPNNAFSFLSYLNREQYASEPLFKGKMFDAKLTGISTDGKAYRKDKDKYAVASERSSYQFDREILFPRIYSAQHDAAYRSYLNLSPSDSPTMGDNLHFFFSYQVGHMYIRYFMWNFVGRQNDNQGHGSYTDGNWLSGIKFVDNLRLGGQYKLPQSEKDNPSRNTYFFLPLVIGCLGMVWHFRKRKNDAIVVAFLFFFTGFAIVTYLNQTPFQPRERDYAYVGSFYAFAIWIGFGTLAITDFFAKVWKERKSIYAAILVTAMGAPILLIWQNWDDHDRSNKFLARDIARNYLESCDPNAILFCYGDNDTYPLWYLQEVEGIRTDVRVVNLSLLGSDWYMKQALAKINDADALPINIDMDKVKEGLRDAIIYKDLKLQGHIDIQDLLAIMLSDNPQNMIMHGDERMNVLPTKHMQLKVDRIAALAGGIPISFQEQLVDTMQWTYPSNSVGRTQLSIMSVLVNNNWKRPIYFTTNIPEENYMGLDKYLISEGFTLRLLPVDFTTVNNEENIAGSVANIDVIYKRIIEQYEWGNAAKSRFIDQDSYRMVTQYLSLLYGNTADKLMVEGKMEEAKSVVRLFANNLPHRDFSVVEVAQRPLLVNTMYRVGENELADLLVHRSLQFIESNLDYHLSIAETKPNHETHVIHYSVAVLQQFYHMLLENEQHQMIAKFDSLFRRYAKL